MTTHTPSKSTSTNPADRLRVFISYARSDGSDFAEYLAAALKLNGFDAYLDRHDIAKAEEWEARIGELIAKSDTVVFVISPASVKSERCDWEVNRAVATGKRLVPVQWIAVDEAVVPDELKRLNYTIFETGNSFAGPLSELTAALEQDLGWLRRQTMLMEQAERWDSRKREPDLLLRGSEIEEARTWARERKINAPEIAPVLNAYIGASEEAEKARHDKAQQQLAERERMVADVEAAQKEKTTALAEAERATAEKLKTSRRLARTIYVGTALLTGVALIAGYLIYEADIQKKQAQAAKDQAVMANSRALTAKRQVDELIRRINVGAANQTGQQALKKICFNAITVTSNLATTNDAQVYKQNSERFWELYYGEMNLVELRQRTQNYTGDPNQLLNSEIESAMVNFGRVLQISEQASEPLPRLRLNPNAGSVRDACVAFTSGITPN